MRTNKYPKDKKVECVKNFFKNRKKAVLFSSQISRTRNVMLGLAKVLP